MQDYRSIGKDVASRLAVSELQLKRFLVIYDGACGVCKASVKYLEKVDVLRQFSYVRLQDFYALGIEKIPIPLLQESIHVIDMNSGEISTASKGVSTLLMHSPPAFPMFMVVLFLRSLGLADKVYARISESRYWLSTILEG